MTGVSIIPYASFARVFPVQGAISIASNIFLGPTGSASSMVLITFFCVILSRYSICSAALPKRVSSPAALKDIIAVTSAPASISFSSSSNAFLKVQKEPHTAKPIFFPLRVSAPVNALAPFLQNIIHRVGNYPARRYGSDLSGQRKQPNGSYPETACRVKIDSSRL